MATYNFASVKVQGLESVSPKVEEADKGYSAPELFVIGTAVELVQGSQLRARYYDRFTSGMTFWPN
jgi:hypothetical protein